MHGTAAVRRTPSSPVHVRRLLPVPAGRGGSCQSGHSVLVDPPGQPRQPRQPPGRLSPEARRQRPPTTALRAQASPHRRPSRRPGTSQMALRRLLASRNPASVTAGTVPCFACRTEDSEDKSLLEKRPPGGARPQPAPATRGLLQITGQPSGAHHFRVQKVPRGHQTQSPLLPTEAIDRGRVSLGPHHPERARSRLIGEARQAPAWLALGSKKGWVDPTTEIVHQTRLCTDHDIAERQTGRPRKREREKGKEEREKRQRNGERKSERRKQ